MTHVEIVGPPGAGKSTLHRKLTNQREFIGGDQDLYIHSLCPLSIYPLISRISSGGSFESICGRLFWKYVHHRSCRSAFSQEFPTATSLFEQAGKMDNRPHYPGIYYMAAERYICLREYASQPFVLDEGLAQLAAEILFLDWDLGMKFLQTIPTPDFVVRVECPAEVCWQRQVQRQKPIATSLKDLGKEQALNKLSTYLSYFSIISDQLQNRNADILQLNTGVLDIEDCSDKITNRVIDDIS